MTIRVTFLVDSPSRRAHGNAVSRLALGLAETERASVTLLCYSDDPPPSWLPHAVRVERLGVDRVSRSVLRLAEHLRASRPDVLITRQVHANFVGLAAASVARRPPGWHGKLVLVQDHPVALSHASNRRDNKWLAKLTYRFADGVISPSPAVRADTSRWCGLELSATAVVPNPVPPFSKVPAAPPHPWLRAGEPPVFVHTSNMTRWKRLDLLIDAFAEVHRHHRVRLLIAGEGAGRSQAVEHIRRRGLENDAATLGWVDDPQDCAARAWAFVLASDEEGFAQVLTEAMSAGCPVITTDAEGGGPRYVTDGGRYGLLVPRGDTAALADAMARLLQPTVREKYAALGLQRAAYFSPRACAGALVTFLDEHLGLTA